MIKTELVNYLTAQINAGLQIEQLRSGLLENGWTNEDIDNSINFINTHRPVTSNTTSQTPQYQTSVSNVNSNESSPKSKKGLIIIVSLFSILILGGGAYAYMNLFKSPEDIMTASWNKLKEAKTVEYEALVEVDIKEEKQEGENSTGGILGVLGGGLNVQGSAKVSGGLDFGDEKNIRGTQNVEITSSLASVQISFKIDSIIDDGNVYAKFPGLGFINLQNSSSGEEKWSKFEIEKLSEMIDINPGNQMKNLKDSLLNSDVFSFNKNLGVEKIDGISMYHYSINIDKEELRVLLKKLMSSNELDNFISKEVDTAMDNITIINGEAWIKKNNNNPYRIKLYIESPRPASDNGKAYIGHFSLDLIFKSLGNKIDVMVPENFEDQTAKIVKTKDESIKNSLDSIRYSFNAPIYGSVSDGDADFGKSLNGSCAEGEAGSIFDLPDEYKDGDLSTPKYNYSNQRPQEEMQKESAQRSIEQLIKIVGGKRKMSCFVDGNNFAVSVEMKANENVFYCISANENMGMGYEDGILVKSLPIGPQCPPPLSTEDMGVVLKQEAQNEDDRAKDYYIESNLARARAEVEIMFDQMGRYGAVANSGGNCVASDENTVFKKSEKISSIISKYNEQEMKCFSDATNYAMAIKFYSKDKYKCVDSTGFSGQVDSLITKASCN